MKKNDIMAKLIHSPTFKIILKEVTMKIDITIAQTSNYPLQGL